MTTKRIACINVAFLLLAAGARAALPSFSPPAADEMRAHFVDVGQGSAVLLEFSCGVALIDTGGEKDKSFDSVAALQTYLDQFFARRPDRTNTIDLLLLTHAHIDHTRGVPMVLKRYKVRLLVDNGLETGSGGPQQKAAHQKARAASSSMKWQAIAERTIVDPHGKRIDPITCVRDLKLAVLWGALDKRDKWPAKTLKNANDSSVVTRLQFGKLSFLFAGDLEEDVQQPLVDFYTPGCVATEPDTCPLRVDVYHVAHHGSQNGTTDALMSAMTPHLAVISMGPWNRREQWSAFAYGHPRAVTIAKLTEGDSRVRDSRARPKAVMVANRAANSSDGGPEFSRTEMKRAVYGTGWDGTVVLTAHSDGRPIQVDVERE